MAFADNKITDAQIAAAGVQSQPNKLTGSAAQNKAVFDALVKNVVQAAFNALIDELAAAGAAGQLGIAAIPGVGADNVQDALEAIKAIADNATAGTITPGSIVTGMLSDGAVTEDKLGAGAVTPEKLSAGILPAGVGIKMGTTVPTAADISDGEIYLQYA